VYLPFICVDNYDRIKQLSVMQLQTFAHISKFVRRDGIFTHLTHDYSR